MITKLYVTNVILYAIVAVWSLPCLTFAQHVLLLIICNNMHDSELKFSQTSQSKMQDRSPSPIKQESKILAQVLHPLEVLKKRENKLSVKQKELRQLEVKIRKRENDLKLKEAKFKEYEKNSSKME